MTADNFEALQSLLKVRGGVRTASGALCSRGLAGVGIGNKGTLIWSQNSDTTCLRSGESLHASELFIKRRNKMYAALTTAGEQLR